MEEMVMDNLILRCINKSQVTFAILENKEQGPYFSGTRQSEVNCHCFPRRPLFRRVLGDKATHQVLCGDRGENQVLLELGIEPETSQIAVNRPTEIVRDLWPKRRPYFGFDMHCQHFRKLGQRSKMYNLLRVQRRIVSRRERFSHRQLRNKVQFMIPRNTPVTPRVVARGIAVHWICGGSTT
ncbi:hypothetical protein ElyMa_005099900 [Elysia marginata]|uniref:Uncharacterized protein n=1 Tax=Elysia marginata TaxID=1093978 RepID=A0AAV4JKM6_9GAST|nr:hypothetical protein ElyMa_005099900 [Elysia marginata]